MANFKVIFSLLFFEHQYLAYYLTCMHQLLHMFSTHTNLGKGLSDFYIGPRFYFMTKKRVTFVIFSIFLQSPIFYIQ